jgi:adenylate cyclase
MAYLLYFFENEKRIKRTVTEASLVIGRAPDCDLVLSQPGVSRRHCVFTQSEGAVVLEDLGSKNGTMVNGVYVRKEPLHSFCDIQIGNVLLKFEKLDARMTDSHRIVLSEEKGLVKEAGTIIRSADQVLAEQLTGTAPAERKSAIPVLLETAKSLLSVNASQDILEKILDQIFSHLPADRGFIMLLNDEGELEPKVIKHRKNDLTDNIEISKTIADMALKEHLSVLTTDAQIDPRFKAGESIRFLGIKSAMCVPLYNGSRAFGIVYLDCPTAAAQFSQEDLDLLTTMANLATVGLEQTQLNERIAHERAIRQKLERYHSPNIVDSILKQASSASGGQVQMTAKEQDVTVLFCDIVGFTSFSEKLPPSSVATFLNDYFSCMTDVIFAFDGTLDKYIGDAIMAIFGAPNVMEDHPVRAVDTALGMIEALELMNQDRNAENQFRIRIGINTGKAIAGDIGSLKRMEYTVLGNTVNVASRLESKVCRPNQVVIGHHTYDRVKDVFEVESLGCIPLKGLSEPEPVYRVLKRLTAKEP